MDAAALAGLNSFGIFDVEADRLDHFFAGLDAVGWARPSRCDGWSVQDVLAHLAGAELYNHACLNGDLDGFRGMLRAAGIAGGYHEFNEWCVRQRRGLPVAEVLAEWREANAETRQRLTGLGRDAPLLTAAGPTRPACRRCTAAPTTPRTPMTWARRWPRAKSRAGLPGGSA